MQLYFEDRKNRSLLAAAFTVMAALESIFFSYVTEGMFSPVYPADIDLLVIIFAACMANFIDFRRTKGIIFIMVGSVIMGAFGGLSIEWFKLGPEDGFFCYQSPTFLSTMARFLLLSILPVLIEGIIKKLWDYDSATDIIPVVCAVLSLCVSLLFGDKFVYSVLLALAALLTAFFISNFSGGKTNITSVFKTLLVVGFVVCCILFYSYNGGMLLTEEAVSAVAILVIFVGLVLALTRNRFGVYLYAFASLHLVFTYLGAWLSKTTDARFLFGIVPLMITCVIGILCDKFGCSDTAVIAKPVGVKKK